jgi:predicted nucleic acid-binding protein
MNNRGSIRLFIDSDVVISSLISISGAAYALLHDKSDKLTAYVSNYSTAELEKVVIRPHLNLNEEGLMQLIRGLDVVDIKMSDQVVQQEFVEYVKDINDAHIVAGAKLAKASFLITYNIRHFKAEKLSQDFGIILLTPGLFLQYLRSL